MTYLWLLLLRLGSRGALGICGPRVQWWYNQEPKMASRRMKKYFKKTMIERAKETNQSLACWIDSVEAHYKYAVDRGDERGELQVPPPQEGSSGWCNSRGGLNTIFLPLDIAIRRICYLVPMDSPNNCTRNTKGDWKTLTQTLKVPPQC